MRFILVVFLLGFTAKSWADTADELLSRCTSTAGPDSMYCIGYIKGFADTQLGRDIAVYIARNSGVPVEELRKAPQKSYMSYCIPDGVTTARLVDVFVKFAKENPQARQEVAPIMLAAAYSAAFPCR
jgi:hypothetical protein